jgi:hypothetical protein
MCADRIARLFWPGRQTATTTWLAGPLVGRLREHHQAAVAGPGHACEFQRDIGWHCGEVLPAAGAWIEQPDVGDLCASEVVCGIGETHRDQLRARVYGRLVWAADLAGPSQRAARAGAQVCQRELMLRLADRQRKVAGDRPQAAGAQQHTAAGGVDDRTAFAQQRASARADQRCRARHGPRAAEMPSGEVYLPQRAAMRVDEALHPNRPSAGRRLNVGAGRDPACDRAAVAHEVDDLMCDPARERTAVDPHDRIPAHCQHRQHRPAPWTLRPLTGVTRPVSTSSRYGGSADTSSTKPVAPVSGTPWSWPGRATALATADDRALSGDW